MTTYVWAISQYGLQTVIQFILVMVLQLFSFLAILSQFLFTVVSPVFLFGTRVMAQPVCSITTVVMVFPCGEWSVLSRVDLDGITNHEAHVVKDQGIAGLHVTCLRLSP